MFWIILLFFVGGGGLGSWKEDTFKTFFGSKKIVSLSKINVSKFVAILTEWNTSMTCVDALFF